MEVAIQCIRPDNKLDRPTILAGQVDDESRTQAHEEEILFLALENFKKNQYQLRKGP